jgi:hypothetical protein
MLTYADVCAYDSGMSAAEVEGKCHIVALRKGEQLSGSLVQAAMIVLVLQGELVVCVQVADAC